MAQGPVRARLIVFSLTLAFLVPGFARAKELPTARAKSVGMSAERLERIRPVMQTYIDTEQIAGMITVVSRDGKIVHHELQGRMDFESDREMQEDAIFRIYSMSKPVVAVALMMLFEEGKFLLSDPVTKFLPELAGMKVYAGQGADGPLLEESPRPATIREVLNHSAGFGYGIIPEGLDPVEDLYREAGVLDRDQTLAEMITKLSKLPLRYAPGTDWSYSVSNDVQGRLVEVISGQTLDVYMKERIFDPLDMPDTGFTVPDEKLDRFTSNYFISEEGHKRIDSPESTRYSAGLKFFSGGGGLVSTARDYMRFATMLLRGGDLDGVRILGPRTISLMMMDHMPDGSEIEFTGRHFEGVGYGLGFGVLVDPARFGAAMSGTAYWWGGAANTGFWVDPQERIVGLVMTQRFPGDQPFAPLLQSLTSQAIEY
ncbi:MAG: serine hydrolase domain-containing protein [Myxococcota bacterium]|nr:serine hydrolase domain-containing protein [Myxococcota bacterium]